MNTPWTSPVKWLVLVALLTGGCGGGGSSSRGGVLLGFLCKSPGLPGLDQFAVAGGDLNHQLVFAVWLDQSGASAATTGPGTWAVRGQLADGRELNVTCTSEDGKKGVVNVGGTEYQLAQGSLFLVSSCGGRLRVKQLTVEFHKLPTGGTPLHDWALSNPEVKGFYTEPIPAAKP